jgi:hypothetical protein
MMSGGRVNTGDLAFFLLISVPGILLFLGIPSLVDGIEFPYAEAAREMLRGGNLLQVSLGFEAQPGIFPLSVWLQAISMKIWGVGAFGARFPNFFFSMGTLLALYFFGVDLKGRFFGRILTALYLGSLVPLLVMRSALPDPAYQFFLLLAFFQIIRFELKAIRLPHSARTDSAPWAAGLLLGIATYAGGPSALLLGLGVWLILKGTHIRRSQSMLSPLKMLLAWLITVLPWVVLQGLLSGSGFLIRMFRTGFLFLPDGGTGFSGPFWLPVLIFFLGGFPLILFFFRGMTLSSMGHRDRVVRGLMVIWFLTSLFINSFSFWQKGIMYTDMFLPAAFLAAFYLFRLVKRKEKPGPESGLLIILWILLIGIPFSLINFIEQNSVSLAKSIHDPFWSVALLQDAGWTGWEWLGGAFLILGLIAGFMLILRRKLIQFVYLQILVNVLFVGVACKAIIPPLIQYVQGVPEDFFSGLKDKDVMVACEGCRGYGHLFFADVKEEDWAGGNRHAILFAEEIPKDVYLAVRTDRMPDGFRREFRLFHPLYEKGGYSFFARPKGEPLRAEGRSQEVKAPKTRTK